ncbi:hypothetical protein [Abyssalbus ytuae]|uniref:CARDB domain-containing protein n=1 Tax=Abyssalbus ytuae TaxID=2926907 RepID=A0A9E7CU31_9FLAO|nr:hypothetical protein [Abyssalbus ytuae]UOB17487.1 hypothetical protein MQE35_17340 [Abyssalbus ytuae]
MAIELEIRDGSPHWYLSPDIWVVQEPEDVMETVPVAGMPFFVKAKVKNNGTSTAVNATVKFYWGNPSIGVNRNTANLIGQSFVSLNAGAEEDVLCLTPWIPEYLNKGHECLIVEAFHSSDPLTGTVDFNVPTDRHVAQKNLSVLLVSNSMFHMNFEMHNGSRKEAVFNAKVEQVKINNLQSLAPHLKEMLEGKNEGTLKNVEFTNKTCIESEELNNYQNESEKFSIHGYGKKPVAVTGEIEGDYVFLIITQYQDKIETGGLGIVIINDKNFKL